MFLYYPCWCCCIMYGWISIFHFYKGKSNYTERCCNKIQGNILYESTTDLRLQCQCSTTAEPILRYSNMKLIFCAWGPKFDGFCHSFWWRKVPLLTAVHKSKFCGRKTKFDAEIVYFVTTILKMIFKWFLLFPFHLPNFNSWCLSEDLALKSF